VRPSRESTCPSADCRTSKFKRPDCVFRIPGDLGRGTNNDTRAARGTSRDGRRRDIPGLPFDVAVSLVEKHLPDPADLAVLRAVSKGMRDAVDATGRKVEEFDENDAFERGYVRTLKCLLRRGRLSNELLVCTAAATRRPMCTM
jgi:hypothetical protein